MPKRLLLAASAAVLFSSVVLAQQAAEPQEAKPSVQEPQEKKPDAFQYFFGRKEKKGPEAAAKEPEVPVQPAVAKEPEPAPAPSVVPAAPVVKAPEQHAPAPAKSQVDAFQYFFGRSAQPAPQTRKEDESPAERKPATAFDYFFGKNGKADSEEPESPPLPRTSRTRAPDPF